MSLLGSLSYWARQWGIYFLYFFALGSIGVMSAYASARLTKRLVTAAVKSQPNYERPVSRVERHNRERARQALRVPQQQTEQVLAIVRPSLHPAVMAAQLDRVETAVASDRAANAQTSVMTVASCEDDACSKTRVRGWRRAAQIKARATIRTAASPDTLSTASGEALAAGLPLLAASKGSRIAGNGAKSDKGAKSSKAKAGAAIVVAATSLDPRLSSGVKTAAPAGKMSLLPKSAIVSQLSASPPPYVPKPAMRFADTPGEIVRVSLLGSS